MNHTGSLCLKIFLLSQGYYFLSTLTYFLSRSYSQYSLWPGQIHFQIHGEFYVCYEYNAEPKPWIFRNSVVFQRTFIQISVILRASRRLVFHNFLLPWDFQNCSVQYLPCLSYLKEHWFSRRLGTDLLNFISLTYSRKKLRIKLNVRTNKYVILSCVCLRLGALSYVLHGEIVLISAWKKKKKLKLNWLKYAALSLEKKYYY